MSPSESTTRAAKTRPSRKGAGTRHRFTWPRLLPEAAVRGLATLGPMGQQGRWRGLLATLAGLVWHIVLFSHMHPAVGLLFIATALYVAAGVCDEYGHLARRREAPEVVLDTFICVPLCLWGLGPAMAAHGSPLVVLCALGLYRALAAWRPPWLLRYPRRLPGGWGTIADDALFALVACMSCHVFFFFA